MEYKFPNKNLLEKHSSELDSDQKYYNLSKLIYQNDFKNKLVFPVGIDNNKEKYYIDLELKSSILIAGETGSGKSMFLNSIIISFLLKNTPSELEFILIDPRGVELNVYNGIPHLYQKVFTDEFSTEKALNYVDYTMEKRREIFIKNKNRNIDEYNKRNNEKIPHLIIILDEVVDIINSSKIQNIICKILSEGYKFGIHLILATNGYFKQYFSKETIKMFDYILTFDLASQEQANYIKISDSNLLSAVGDALIKCPGDKIVNIQTPYVSLHDIEEVVNYIKSENKL